MAAKGKKGQVHTKWDFEWLTDPLLLAGGFAIPRELEVTHEPSPGIHVQMHVTVDDVRARCDRITVETDRPGGIGLDVLRGIQVRNIMATALLDSLHKIKVGADGGATFGKVGGPSDAERSEEIRAIVQRLVGWVRA